MNTNTIMLRVRRIRIVIEMNVHIGFTLRRVDSTSMLPSEVTLCCGSNGVFSSTESRLFVPAMFRCSGSGDNALISSSSSGLFKAMGDADVVS